MKAKKPIPFGGNTSLLAIMFLSIIAFVQVMTFQFIGWDDTGHIYLNIHLQGLDLQSYSRFWRELYFGLYIPVTYSLWTLATILSKIFSSLQFSPGIFHSFNFFIHLLNVFLLWKVMAIFFKEFKFNEKFDDAVLPVILMFSVGVFAVHPLQVETIAWASELKGVFSTTLILCSVLAFFRIRMKKTLSIKDFVGIYVFTILAMLAKPSAIVLPALLLCLLYFSQYRQKMKFALKISPLFLFSIGIILITKFAQEGISGEFSPEIWQKPLIALNAISNYLLHFLVPYHLTPDYGLTPQSFVLSDLKYLSILPGLCLILLTIYAFIKKNTQLAICLICLFILLSPILGLVDFHFQKHSTVADRYMYLPIIFMSLSFILLIPKKVHFILPKVLWIILIGLTISSFFQTRHWKNTESLFSYVVQRNPLSYAGLNQLGLVKEQQGNKAEARKLFSQCIQAKRNYQPAHVNLGYNLLSSGQFRQAVTHYQQMIKLFPDFGLAHSLLGVSFASLGKYNLAKQNFQKAISLSPLDGVVLYNWGQFLEQSRQSSDAIKFYKKAIKHGKSEKSYLRLVQIYLSSRRFAQARKWLDKALADHPNSKTLNQLKVR